MMWAAVIRCTGTLSRSAVRLSLATTRPSSTAEA